MLHVPIIYRCHRAMASFICKLTVFLAIEIQLTYTDLTLSTGSFIRHKGTLHVVDDYLGLLLDFSHLNQFNDQFIELQDQLSQFKDTVKLPSCTLISPELNSNIISELTEELNDVITPVSNRRKRAWPALVVSGLSALLGFSTQVQVLYLQNRLSDVVQSQRNLHIQYIETKERLQETHNLVNLLQIDIDNLKHIIANISHNVELCFQSTQITSVLLNIKLDLEKTLSELRSYINSIIMVSDGKVTADILPLETLNRILYNDSYNRRVNPIFPIESTHMYYPFLEAQLTTKGLLITLPLQATRTFDYYSFTPHPTCAENQSLTLNVDKTELLVDINTHSHFEEDSEVLNNCPSHFGLTICNHIYITVVDSKEDTCLYSLLNSMLSSPSCRFHSVSFRPESLPLLLRIEDFTLLHNPSSTAVRLSCPDNSTITEECDFIVPIQCGIRTENKVIQPIPVTKVPEKKRIKRRYVKIPLDQIQMMDSDSFPWFIGVILLCSVVAVNIVLGFIISRRTCMHKGALPRIIHSVAK